MTEKIAFTVAEAAQASGLSRSSLYLLMREGRLNSVKVAGRRLVLKTALASLLSAHEGRPGGH